MPILKRKASETLNLRDLVLALLITGCAQPGSVLKLKMCKHQHFWICVSFISTQVVVWYQIWIKNFTVDMRICVRYLPILYVLSFSNCCINEDLGTAPLTNHLALREECRGH